MDAAHRERSALSAAADTGALVGLPVNDFPLPVESFRMSRFGWSREAHVFVAAALARAAKDEADSALADSARALLVANRGWWWRSVQDDPRYQALRRQAG